MPKREPAFDLGPAGAAALADHLRDMRRREIRASTMRDREYVLRRFGRFIAPRQVLDTTETDLEAWIDDQLARELAVASRHVYLAHVRQFFAWAARRGLIEVDPALDLTPPPVRPGRPRPIPEEDLRLALMTAGPRLRVWLVLGAYVGLRAGEIARLRREHILDTEQPPLLMVVNGKGGRSRVVPLSPMVLAELGDYLGGRRGRLWLDTSTYPVHRVTDAITEHMRSLGLPYTTHSLRHRFGTRVYKLSRDLRLTQDYLGHASPATTQVYADWDHERGLELLNELGEELRAAPVILPEQGRRPGRRQ